MRRARGQLDRTNLSRSLAEQLAYYPALGLDYEDPTIALLVIARYTAEAV